MTRIKMLFVPFAFIFFLCKGITNNRKFQNYNLSFGLKSGYSSSIIVRCKSTVFLNNFNKKTYFLTIIHCKRLFFCVNQLKSASVSSLEMRKCGVLL